MTRGQKAILIAGALLVFGIGLLWRLTDPSKAPPPPPRKEKSGAPLSAIPKATGVGSAIPRKAVTFAPAEDRPEPASDPYEDWPLEKILDNFMVPPGHFYAENLGGAVNGLNAVYGRHSDGRELHITLVGALSDQPIALDHGNISFRSLLDIVATLGGGRTSIDGDVITFSPFTDPEASAHTEVLVGSDIGSFQTAPDDPFAADPPPTVFAPARYFRERYGIELPPGLTVHRDPDDLLMWTIDGPAQSVALVEALIAAEMPAHTPQAMITQSIIRTPPGVEFDSQSMTESGLQELMAEVDQTEGVELLSTPSLVTLPGQRAQFEIAREVVFPTGHDDNGQPSGFEIANVGMSLPISAVFAGLDRVHVTGAAEFTTVGDQQPTQVFGSNGIEPELPTVPTPDSVHVHGTDFEGHLIDGDTALIEVARDPDGHAIYQFLTTRRITPNGSPAVGR